MSDVSGDEVEGFDNAEFDAFQRSTKKRSRDGDNSDEEEADTEEKEPEEEPEKKKRKTKTSPKVMMMKPVESPDNPKSIDNMKDQHSSHENKVSPDLALEEPEMTFVHPTEVLADQDHDPNLYVKTTNVKDFSNVLLGCCSTPGIEHIVMTFDPMGMQLYAKPKDTPTCVTAFFNKEMFSEYKVTKTTQRVMEKVRLDSLKKKISKEVEFLEITSWQDNPGYTFSGYRLYKTGGKCKFNFNIADVVESIKTMNMSTLSWEWLIRTSSQKFKDNVDFIDDSNEFIRMTISSNLLEFQGIRDTGQIGETIDQETESKITEKFQALFHKKHLKIITTTKDLNRALKISFNLPCPNSIVYPVHFSYELDNAAPQSHFSAYLMPHVNDSD